MIIFQLNQIRLAKIVQNEKEHIVIVFGYDRGERKAICCKFSMENKKLQISKILLDELLIFDINFMNNMISDENDSNQDIMGGLAYLMHVGLDENNWNSDWNISNWNKFNAKK